ncbi:hypothetical protein M0802_015194 [Mischocyttarus mexicanus]|nr:hypothetical protein M0802_015194 [Mischocyttarus mexicanus]
MDFLLVINGPLMTVGTAVEWEYFLWSLEFFLSRLTEFCRFPCAVGCMVSVDMAMYCGHWYNEWVLSLQIKHLPDDAVTRACASVRATRFDIHLAFNALPNEL